MNVFSVTQSPIVQAAIIKTDRNKETGDAQSYNAKGLLICDNVSSIFDFPFDLKFTSHTYKQLLTFLMCSLGNCHYILFTKLPWPVDSEGTFRSSSQAASCLPHGEGFTLSL